MQCIRGNRKQSSASSSTTSTTQSMDSLIKYLEHSLNRKSFLRRSFDLVRRSFVRPHRHFPRNGLKNEKWRRTNEGNRYDPNNNSRHSAPILFSTSAPDTYQNHTYDVDVLSLSTNCDIFTSKRIKPNKKDRWVYYDNFNAQCEDHQFLVLKIINFVVKFFHLNCVVLFWLIKNESVDQKQLVMINFLVTLFCDNTKFKETREFFIDYLLHEFNNNCLS